MDIRAYSRNLETGEKEHNIEPETGEKNHVKTNFIVFSAKSKEVVPTNSIKLSNCSIAKGLDKGKSQ